MDYTKNIFDVARFRNAKRRELNELVELRRKAYTVYSDAPGLGLKNIRSQLHNWKKLAAETSNSLTEQEWEDIFKSFHLVFEANISKKEFREVRLLPAKKAIEEYLKQLAIEIYEAENILNDIYANFVQRTGELKEKFTDEKVKDLILNELLKG